MFPGKDKLPENWGSDCRKVIQKFYHGNDILLAETELNRLIDGHGTFGSDYRLVNQEIDWPQGMGTMELAIWMQLQSHKVDMETNWLARYGRDFPMLKDIAMRVM